MLAEGARWRVSAKGRRYMVASLSDRSGQFEEPEGYKWALSQHVEDVSPEEMQRRMAKMGG